jgi:hypothetical protein
MVIIRIKPGGLRKKAGRDNDVPSLIDSDISRRNFRKNWARLVQKIYNVDPLKHSKCHGKMRIISFIEQPEIIKKILKHLNLWDTRINDPPAKKPEHIPELFYDDSISQIPETDYWSQ